MFTETAVSSRFGRRSDDRRLKRQDSILREGLKRTVLLNVPAKYCLDLNMCGRSFSVPLQRLRTHNRRTKLGQFSLKNHQERLELCDGFLGQTGEYVFVWSPFLFDLVYRFYMSGVLHKPASMCIEQFREVLDFWEIPTDCIDSCCRKVTEDRRNEAELAKLWEEEEQEVENEFEGQCMVEARQFIWNLIENSQPPIIGRPINVLSIFIVLLSVLQIIAASIPEMQVPMKNGENDTEKVEMHPLPFLHHIDVFCNVVFTIEFLLRLFTTPNRKKFFKSPMNWIDLVAILPFHLEVCLSLAGVSSRQVSQWKPAFLVMRILRVLRVVRVFKLARYNTLLLMFMMSMRRSYAQLWMTFVLTFTGVLIFSTAVYYLEYDEHGNNFYSIPAGFWWCLVTMTTVGYGDMFPKTTLGKLAGGAAIVCGRLVMALPMTIVVNNFTKVIKEMESKRSMDKMEMRGHVVFDENDDGTESPTKPRSRSNTLQ